MIKRIRSAYRKRPDLLSALVLFAAFLFIIALNLFVLHRGGVWGSKMDWSSQHFTIPEYLRMRFFETGDWHPDFAMQLGGGQNIYDLAYYGIAAPLYLPAYFMPWVTMAAYIQFISITGVYVSALMTYYLFKRHFRGALPLALALLFLFAGPIVFHSHRHIMFVNYYPFLLGMLLAAGGKDCIRNWLLMTVFACCIVCTSYYYSVGAFGAVGIYLIYNSLEQKQDAKVKEIFGMIWKKLLFSFMGCVCAARLWMPTLAAIISGRASTSVDVSLYDLLVPTVNMSVLLYTAYSAGLTCLAPISVIALLKDGKRSERFLAGFAAVCVLFPVVIYLLNGTMYVEGKAFIPFIPLLLILCGRFLIKLLAGEANVKFTMSAFFVLAVFALKEDLTISQRCLLAADTIVMTVLVAVCTKKKNYRALMAYILLFPFGVCIGMGCLDNFVKLGEMRELYSDEPKQLVSDTLDSDTDVYRFAEDPALSMTVNKVYRTDYLTTNIYSSLSNPDFRKFRFYSSSCEIGTRNNAIHMQPKNILFNTLMGCRYRLAKDGDEMFGESLVSTSGDYSVFRNENALPLGYVCSNTMPEDRYMALPWEYQQETLLTNIIVPEENEDNGRAPEHTQWLEVDFSSLASYKGISYGNRMYTVKSRKPIKARIELESPVEDKVLIITAFADNRIGRISRQSDIHLTINGVKNKLTDPNWKYNNGNYVFSYVISSNEPITALDMEFSAGNYTISGLEACTVDGSVFRSAMDNKVPLVIDTEDPLGDTISGTVDVKEDGWFNISFPYDKHFCITVDGERVDYCRTNLSFIGFPITAGEHSITVEYKAPMKEVGLRVSLAGAALTLLMTAGFWLYGSKKKGS